MHKSGLYRKERALYTPYFTRKNANNPTSEASERYSHHTEGGEE